MTPPTGPETHPLSRPLVALLRFLFLLLLLLLSLLFTAKPSLVLASLLSPALHAVQYPTQAVRHYGYGAQGSDQHLPARHRSIAEFKLKPGLVKKYEH
jgi:hypothetical protein